jgi:dihydrofolate synthase / folylpolyglutamate synthase
LTLAELTPWLFSRTTVGIRWGLDRTERLLAGVGNPHRLFHSLHIAGTNGKGSVAALCDAALRRQGDRRVGLYTSPHLVRFNERIRIDGVPVADAALVDAAERLRPEIEATGASFFEATTAIAFLIFAEAGVETSVVEVGLGGRLDSTNVLLPMVTGVTNIALDHAEYLGDTLEGIAAEKGGIFKRGVPALSGVAEPALEEVLRRAAGKAGAEFHSLDSRSNVRDVEVSAAGTALVLESRQWGERTLRTALPGRHQARNAAFAAELLGLLPATERPAWDAVAEGFAAARWPGRLQIERVRGTTYLFDVAHNPDGARTLASALPELDLPRPLVLLVGILADKQWQQMLPPLLERSDACILTIPSSAPPGRVWNPSDVLEHLESRQVRRCRTIPDFRSALDRAATLAPHGTVLVTGSVHTVGDALQLLQLPDC